MKEKSGNRKDSPLRAGPRNNGNNRLALFACPLPPATLVGDVGRGSRAGKSGGEVGRGSRAERSGGEVGRGSRAERSGAILARRARLRRARLAPPRPPPSPSRPRTRPERQCVSRCGTMRLKTKRIRLTAPDFPAGTLRPTCPPNLSARFPHTNPTSSADVAERRPRDHHALSTTLSSPRGKSSRQVRIAQHTPPLMICREKRKDVILALLPHAPSR